MATRRRKAPARSRATAPPTPIQAPHGQQLHLLDVPFADRALASHHGARWDAARRTHVYVGDPIPAALAIYLPAPMSWEARLAEDTNGTPTPAIGPAPDAFAPRTHQLAAVEMAVRAHLRGLPGWLIADDTGLGKTATTVWAIHELPAGLIDVLVVCPKSVIPTWRTTIAQLGTQHRRFTVINYDQTKKLLGIPKSAARAVKKTTQNKKIAEDGVPLVDWDVVVFDEAHNLGNPTSQRSKVARSLTRNAKMTFWASATAGQTPLELSYLAPLLGAVTGQPVEDLEQFEQWCAAVGIGVRRGAYGKWEWDPNPADLHLMERLLFQPWTPGRPVAGVRRRPEDIAGWPEKTRILHPVDLDADGRRLYEELWTEFRSQMELVAHGGNPANGLAAQTRFRQKASLLRVPGIVDHTRTLLDEGRQVVISCQWLETLDAIAEQLEDAGVSVATMDGSHNGAEREAERQRFQTGEATVVVTTITEGISLHASGGNGVPRAMLLADIRWSGKACHQLEGRAHRAGDHAPIFWCYAVDTVEAKVAKRALERMTSMGAMQGDDTTDLEHLLTDEALAAA